MVEPKNSKTLTYDNNSVLIFLLILKTLTYNIYKMDSIGCTKKLFMFFLTYIVLTQ